MPPRGNTPIEVDDSDFPKLNRKNSEFLRICLEDGLLSKDVESVLQLMDSASLQKEFLAKFKTLNSKACNINRKIPKNDLISILEAACLHSIRDAMTTIMERVGAILYIGGDKNSAVSGVVLPAIDKSSLFFDELDKIVSKSEDVTFDKKLAKLVGGDKLFQNIKVSPRLSNTLAFEFNAGLPAENHFEAKGSDSVALSVRVEPILYVQAPRIDRDVASLKNYKTLETTVSYCAHEKKFSTCSYGIFGEALIRIQVMPDTLEKRARTWGEGDVARLSLIDATIVQRNAPTHQRQAKLLDHYVSYQYGSSAITVTLKVQTCITSIDETPFMDIKLVLEPPSSE